MPSKGCSEEETACSPACAGPARRGGSEARPSAGGIPVQTASPSGNGWRGTEGPFLSNVLYLRRRAAHQDFIKDARALWGRAEHLTPAWALLVFNRQLAATGPCPSRQQPSAPSRSGGLWQRPKPAVRRPAVAGLVPRGPGRPNTVPWDTTDKGRGTLEGTETLG